MFTCNNFMSDDDDDVFRFYLFGIHLIEILAMLEDPQEWADVVPRSNHPRAVAEWKSSPEKKKRLVHALASVFEERIAAEHGDEEVPSFT